MKLRFVALLGLALTGVAHAKPAQITINNVEPGPVIHPHIYGQFTEHLGDGIYGGLYVGKDSDIPNTDGFRNDVIGALKELHVPLIRWPGGCFADEYHWRDGIGPHDERVLRTNVSWGGAKEDNSFGTHEFFQLVEMLGAEAYVNGNLGSGTVQEMVEWLEYMTSDNDSAVVRERRKNGREKPWKLAYYAVGNESWGCGGHMTPQHYADLYKHWTTFLKAPADNRPKLIASGGHSDLLAWTEELSKIENNIDGISFHYYTLPTADWGKKGAATGFPEAEWMSTFVNTLKMEDFIVDNVAVLEKNDPEGKIGFYVDEWGTWFDTDEETKDRILFQRNTIRDALVAAVNFNMFHRHAERVTMTMIAQMVNVLQAMILTEGDKMVLTPTYHAFKMYIPFQGATSLPFKAKKLPKYKLGKHKVDALSFSSARTKDGKLVVALANIDPNQDHEVTLQLKDGKLTKAVGHQLSATKMDAENTYTAPSVVAPKTVSFDLSGDGTLTVPSKAILVLTLN